MEDGKKKKRSKKKKNKQNKPSKDAVCEGEASSADQSHVENGRIALKGGLQDAVAVVAEEEKVDLRPSEVSAEDKIKQLQVKTDSYMLKEAALEETVKQLREENDSYLQKEAYLEGTIRLLKDEKDSHLQKVAMLEDKIIHFQDENCILVRKETSLEGKIRQLLEERSTLALKGASLEEKLTQLERERESCLIMENSFKETISSLNNEITRLQRQAVELEESKTILFEQKQQLLADVSDLQVQLRNHERNMLSSHPADELKMGALEQEDLKSQIEAACALVERLIAENAELVEKVNALCMKLNQQSISQRLSSVTENGSLEGIADTMRVADSVSLSTENIPALAQKSQLLEDIPIDDEVVHDDSYAKNAGPAAVSTNTFENDSGEIVPVSIDDNEDRKTESQVVERNDRDSVPLMDAPLIGAPFRLVSFVARYVSGADLVENNPLITRY